MSTQNNWVYDYETLKNCFIAVFEHYKTDEQHIFEISYRKNDLPKLITFLKENIKLRQWHISFNGIAFDMQITQFILKEYKKLNELNKEECANEIYKKAQEIIEKSNAGLWPDYSERDVPIKQIDLYKLNHWDNKNKSASLKWIQCSMRWPNVEEMPIPHFTTINSKDQIDQIIKYCINDVKSTKEIYKISIPQIALRKKLTTLYGINLYSASETKIAKELLLLHLSQKTGINITELKKLRTHRSSVEVKDIILPYVKFRRPEFQKLLEMYKKLVVHPIEKTKFKHIIQYRGSKTTYGLGGLHGARSSGIYKAENGMIIVSSDVVSFYPSLIMQNEWAPAHLPQKVFNDLYKWFFEERKKIPKDDPLNYIYKIILNAICGLSNEINSFLYDPELFIKVTVNGQLTLTMLYEMLCERVPGAIPLMQNTDGLEIIIPENQYDTYMQICSEWENLARLRLEHATYQKMFISDVNNYIALYNYKEVTEDLFYKLKREKPEGLFKQEKDKYYYAETKCKGRFEFKDRQLHKDPSNMVVPKAIYEFFIHNVPPEKYLDTNKNIYDYAISRKIKSKSHKFIKEYIKDGLFITEELQKTIRYYISNKGCKIVKRNIKTKEDEQLEAGIWMQKVFNNAEQKEWDKYDVNTKYYLDKIYNEIYKIQTGRKIQQGKLNF